jgi:hypothetical protein
MKMSDRMSENEPKSRRAAAPPPPPNGPPANTAAAVVLLALLGIRQDVVGLGDLLEALLRPGSLLVSGWYLRASLRYAFLMSSCEAFCRRRASCSSRCAPSRLYAATTTRAGRSTGR